jgi:hypothetical protein
MSEGEESSRRLKPPSFYRKTPTIWRKSKDRGDSAKSRRLDFISQSAIQLRLRVENLRRRSRENCIRQCDDLLICKCLFWTWFVVGFTIAHADRVLLFATIDHLFEALNRETHCDHVIAKVNAVRHPSAEIDHWGRSSVGRAQRSQC